MQFDVEKNVQYIWIEFIKMLYSIFMYYMC